MPFIIINKILFSNGKWFTRIYSLCRFYRSRSSNKYVSALHSYLRNSRIFITSLLRVASMDDVLCADMNDEQRRCECWRRVPFDFVHNFFVKSYKSYNLPFDGSTSYSFNWYELRAVLFPFAGKLIGFCGNINLTHLFIHSFMVISCAYTLRSTICFCVFQYLPILLRPRSKINYLFIIAGLQCIYVLFCVIINIIPNCVCVRDTYKFYLWQHSSLTSSFFAPW